MTTTFGPECGPTAMPIGSLPPVAGPHAVSGESSQLFGAHSTNVSISFVVLTPFHRLSVESRPTPTFTRPSPSGKIQP